MQDNKIKKSTKREVGHFDFYSHKRWTLKTGEPAPKEEIESIEDGFYTLKFIPTKEELGIKDDPELLLAIDKIKDQIAEYALDLGIDVSKRFIANKNIYFLNEELYARFSKQEKPGGYQTHTEIAIAEKCNEQTKLFKLRHELIHSVTKYKLMLILLGERSVELKTLGLGFQVNNSRNDGKARWMEYFNEGLTELMNICISLKFQDDYLFQINYAGEVAFVLELARDIAKKLNMNPEKAEAMKTKIDLASEITKRDVIAYFLTGMIEGNMTFLKIISDIYDRYTDGMRVFNALGTLACMENTYKSVMETAEKFGIGNETKNAIKDWSELADESC